MFFKDKILGNFKQNLYTLIFSLVFEYMKIFIYTFPVVFKRSHFEKKIQKQILLKNINNKSQNVTLLKLNFNQDISII